MEERKEHREAQREKIEDIERNKVALRKGLLLSGENGDDVDIDIDNDGSGADGTQEQERKTYQDEHTAHQFGGSVSVTTTFGIPPEDDDEDDLTTDDYDPGEEIWLS